MQGWWPFCREDDNPYLLIERARIPPPKEVVPHPTFIQKNPNFDCEGVDMIPVFKSEVIECSLEPTFAPISRKMDVLCGGDKGCILKFTIKRHGG